MSQVSLLLPIFGVFFSYLFLKEAFYPSMAISLVFLIMGLFILQKGYKKNKP
jgi:drug/metabolite transporter (DMT)-like permease